MTDPTQSHSRSIGFQVYHSKTGPEKPHKLRISEDADGNLPTGEELCKLIVERLNLEDSVHPDEEEDEEGQVKSRDQKKTWLLYDALKP